MRRLAHELGVDIERMPRSFRAGINRLLEVSDMDQLWSAAQRVSAKKLNGPQKHAWPLQGQEDA
jgi:hypothetical protein